MATDRTFYGYGARLLEARQKAKLTAEEVAAKIGVSVQSMRFYESERRVPRDEVKMKLAELYNTTIVALFFAE